MIILSLGAWKMKKQPPLTHTPSISCYPCLPTDGRLNNQTWSVKNWTPVCFYDHISNELLSKHNDHSRGSPYPLHVKASSLFSSFPGGQGIKTHFEDFYISLVLVYQSDITTCRKLTPFNFPSWRKLVLLFYCWAVRLNTTPLNNIAPCTLLSTIPII